MSNKTNKKTVQSPGQRWALLKRRIALGLYLAFLATAAVGSQGPWWQVWNTASDRPIKAKPDYGDDYARWSWVPTDDPASPTVQVENRLRPAVIALLACAVGSVNTQWSAGKFVWRLSANLKRPSGNRSIGYCLES